jgi:hypothetical protein
VTSALAQPLAVLCALAGAGCYAIASVTQQRAAARLPSSVAVDPVVLVRLVRAKPWLASLIAVAAGYGLQAAALGLGRLVVVEPVFPAGLLFALLLAARVEGRRMRHAEWTAALAAIAGMAVFLIAAHPSGGQSRAPAGTLAIVAGGAIAVAATCCLLAFRVTAAHRALTLSIAGGIGAGVTDALTKTVVTLPGPLKFGVFADPRLYLLALVGLSTFTLQQNGYRAAGLAASLPAFAVLEPVVGALLGLAIYHEQVGVSPLRIGIEVVAVLAAFWGIARLARSVIAVSARLAAAATAAAVTAAVAANAAAANAANAAASAAAAAANAAGVTAAPADPAV